MKKSKTRIKYQKILDGKKIYKIFLLKMEDITKKFQKRAELKKQNYNMILFLKL